MAKIKIKFDGDWYEQTDDSRRLADAGYAVGAIDGKYVLFRKREEGSVKYSLVHEFDTTEELHKMLDLLIEGS